MQEEDPLFEYIEKMKDVVEFLARGNELETSRMTSIFFNDAIAREQGKISMVEINNCDELEETKYNELGSIERLVSFINDGDYDAYNNQIGWDNMEEMEFDENGYAYTYDYQYDEDQDEEIDDEDIEDDDYQDDEYDDEYEWIENPEETREYKAVMKRFKTLISKIVFQLHSGLKVMLKEYDTSKILEEDTNDEEKELYLVYDASKKYFNVMQGDEIIIDNIDIAPAMQITVDYLYESDMSRRADELQTGKAQTENYKYRGWKIPPEDGHEER